MAARGGPDEAAFGERQIRLPRDGRRTSFELTLGLPIGSTAQDQEEVAPPPTLPLFVVDQARHNREARRKQQREKLLQRRGITRARSMVVQTPTPHLENKAPLLESRFLDRKVKEKAVVQKPPPTTNNPRSVAFHNPNPNPNPNIVQDRIAVIPMQVLYQPAAVFPCMVPCWIQAALEKTLYHVPMNPSPADATLIQEAEGLDVEVRNRPKLAGKREFEGSQVRPNKMVAGGATAAKPGVRGGTGAKSRPCVGTKREDGTVLTGYLYEYSTRKICIVCSCHGFKMTPSEFLRHAGRADLENPMRNIVLL